MSKFRLLMLGCLIGMMGMPVSAGMDDRPLAVRNLSPVSLLYGLPRMRGARACCEELTLSVNLAQVSNFTSANIAGTALFFDGETTVFDYSAMGSWSTRGEWGITLPFVMHSGGFLDGFIDGFHSTFGLPEGGRERARRNQLDYVIRVDGENQVSFRVSRRGLGDVQAWAGYALVQSPERGINLRAQVKLPTGRVNRLTGSEGTDLALWAELQERALLRALKVDVSLGAGLVWLGEGELEERSQESLATVWHLGLRRMFGKRVSVLAQLDAHSQLHDNPADALGGEALIGSLGLRALITPRLQLEFALLEDLKTRSTSDVVFQLQLDARL